MNVDSARLWNLNLVKDSFEMQIGGIQRFSTIDFPEKIAAVVFTVGCNFRCPFCHNPQLVTDNVELISEKHVLEFLSSRIHRLDGVVISGGEPTLQKDLINFIEKIRSLGFLIKLDTNGTNPDILEMLISSKIVNFIAMDIKHVWSRYAFSVGLKSVTIESLQRSVDLIIRGDISHEFRTTVIRDFHDLQDIVAISEQIRGAKRYVVQKFISKKTFDVAFFKKLPFENSLLETIIPQVEKNVQQFKIYC